MDWLDLLAVQKTLKSLLQDHKSRLFGVGGNVGPGVPEQGPLLTLTCTAWLQAYCFCISHLQMGKKHKERNWVSSNCHMNVSYHCLIWIKKSLFLPGSFFLFVFLFLYPLSLYLFNLTLLFPTQAFLFSFSYIQSVNVRSLWMWPLLKQLQRSLEAFNGKEVLQSPFWLPGLTGDGRCRSLVH